MNYNNRWSEIKYLSEIKNIKLKNIATYWDVSLFYLRKKIKNGDDDFYKKCKKILE